MGCVTAIKADVQELTSIIVGFRRENGNITYVRTGEANLG